MLRRLRRLLVTALLTLLVASGFQLAANGAGTAGGAGVAAQGPASLASRSRLQGPSVSVRRHPTSLARPRLAGHGVSNGAEFTWGRVRGAAKYRVAWSAVPFGKWPATRSWVSRWLPKSARSSTFAVGAPQPGDHMLGVAYANPVFAQLYARNAKRTVRHSTGWVPVFPTAPDPGPGNAMRVGTYNVMLAPTSGVRIQAIAANISSHGLGVVALQEATTQTAQAVVAALGPRWTYVPYANSPEQIVYQTSYRLLGSGVFDVPDAKTPAIPLATPWARFLPVNASASTRPVLVSSVHVTEDASKSAMDRKRGAGQEAQAMMAGVNGVAAPGDAVVIAGDLHYLREPFGDVPGYVEAPPTLVRGGYYNAMAAVSKTNFAYGTFNGGNGTTAPAQPAALSGVAAGPDYVMLKGFRGSNAYVNVANWSFNGIVPSDHNLVYADVTVPYAG